MSELIQPPIHLVHAVVAAALAEDLGSVGDLTSNAIFSLEDRSQGSVVARQAGTIAGAAIAARVFNEADDDLAVTVIAVDGATVQPGDVVLTVSGRTRSILTAERTALNLLGRLSGIATLTASYVGAVEHTAATIVDTRKTTPGLRALEKFAVRAGGGHNHRLGLYDAVMIKDNHVAASGGVTSAVERVKQSVGHTVKIEVEVDTLAQLDELMGVSNDVDIVLLDNMSLNDLRQAVATVAGALVTEASGGVSLETVAAIAETGVDLISVGALTHSAPNFDVGMDF